MRMTQERVHQLYWEGFFELSESPACVAILPQIKPYYTGVEIGVYKGQSSVLFLEHCRHMIFIDPCLAYPENPDMHWIAQEDKFLSTLSHVRPRSYKFIKEMSSKAAPLVPRVDFVFIDGNHAYEYVKADIELYWPKIRFGGFLCGHDCHVDPVKRAVSEFFGPLGLPIERHQYCWLVRQVDTYASDRLALRSP